MTEKTQAMQPGTELFNDPNCALTITPQGSITDYPSAVSNQNIADAHSAIAQLSFEDIWRLPPFSIQYGSIRLEVRGVIAGGGRSWEILINGTNGSGPISSTLVQGNVVTASTDDRRAYVQRMVQNALVQSLATKNITDVTGPCR
ncbi:hypothetical protein ACE38W_14085 [Chitinophaga sp. Hz27]|uniref:hypothetical protein n=1 Tax=Chitinophaga sp. Hz27 TaxID=3347169 RepID=UPI0035DF49D7